MSTATEQKPSDLPNQAANQSTQYTLLCVDLENALGGKLSDASKAMLADTESLSVEHATNLKSARKTLKKNPTIAILLVYLNAESGDDTLELINFIRKGLRNQIVRIIACGADNTSYSEEKLVQEYAINTYKDASSLKADTLLATIISEIKTYKQFKTSADRRQAEIGLLTTLAQFSRMELSLHDCVSEFNNTIGMISGALLSNVLLVGENNVISRSSTVYSTALIPEHIAKKFVETHQHQFNNTVSKASSEGALQICLDQNDAELKSLTELSGVNIDGSLAFPLKSYNRTLAVIQCFLQKEQMDQVSVELIHLVEKSSEQLSVLLERQEAEKNLETQYERLKTTLEELKAAKSQLYQSEKMASIGQLAAGIAHEINNPIAFVMSNFSPLDEYVETMSKLLNMHNAFMDSIDKKDEFATETLKSSISSFSEQADINFVLDDVRSLVADSQDGLARVKDIITNLKNFSHVDGVESEQTDIHDNIESTLKILHYQTKMGIEIIKDYGDLPYVNCNPGLINQVFMNIIQNAIQALGEQGSIQIKTRQSGNNVEISIKDNGPGIPEDKINEIFNPFFTTKPVGQGTGLGLSMCHNIIKKHKGKIEVSSQPGEFTEFIITLPIEIPATE